MGGFEGESGVIIITSERLKKCFKLTLYSYVRMKATSLYN